MAANIKLVSLRQFSKMGANAGIKCMCGRVSTIDPQALIRIAERLGVTMDKIDVVKGHLRCSNCGQKGRCRIGWSWDKPGTVTKEGG